jgi:hypothetical protein
MGVILLLGLLVVVPWMTVGFSLPKALLLGAAGFVLRGPRRGSFDRILALLWWVLLCTTLFSVDPFASIHGRYNDWSHGLVGWAAFTVFLMHGTSVMPSERERTVTLLVRGTMCIAVLCLVQRLWMQRSIGTVGDPVAMGALLAMMLPICASRSPLTLAVMLPAIWATGTRGAMLGGLLGLIVLVRPRAA